MADFSQLLGRTLVLVAHPDDETVGCGALLQRIAEPTVVFVTDGAPRDKFFWGKYSSRLRYQRVREEEARAALSVIGISEIKFLGSEPICGTEGIVDQELHMHLAAANEQITKLIRRTRPEAILTLAYEGGHPDHDCCSILAAHLAVEHGVPLWEFPLYHRAASGEIAYQRFIISAPSDGVALEVTSEELAKKQTMLKAYGSQHPFLFDFDPKVERFRPQHACDYTCPPHAGKLNYEAWGWPISGHDVCAAYAELVATHSAVKR